ncbi:MAG: hypothetical protein ACO259_10105 [Bacteroidia bacterium]
MKNLVLVNARNRDLTVLGFSDGFVAGEGTYRVITKCKAGFMVTSDTIAKNAIGAFRQYKPKAIQSIAFMLNGHPITVYARAGKKVWASECFLREVEVSDINQELYNTALYSQNQYAAVNAKSWASKAYVMNEENIEIILD